MTQPVTPKFTSSQIMGRNWSDSNQLAASQYVNMDDIKAKTASGEYQIVDNISPKAKSDVWEKSGVIRECGNNGSGFVASKNL